MAPRASKPSATATTSAQKPNSDAKKQKAIPRVKRPATPPPTIEGKRIRKQVQPMMMPESCRVVYKRKPTIAQVRAKALEKARKAEYKPYVPGQVCVMRESYSPPEIRQRRRKSNKKSARRPKNSSNKQA